MTRDPNNPEAPVVSIPNPFRSTDMSNEPNSEANREEFMTALFANLVLQQSNLGLLFLGQAPHPETGKTEVNLDGAQMIISQLEMLEAKTKGNLSKEESSLLQQSLMSLRMTFVNAVNAPAATPSAPTGSTTPKAAESTAPAEAAVKAAVDAEAEARKKFSKKY